MRNLAVFLLVALLIVGISWHFLSARKISFSDVPLLWSSAVSPGPLASSHASYESDCRVCHTQGEGVTPKKCVMCHGTSVELLGRKKTTFHASVKDCRGCHVEHQGRDAVITKMSHTHLARLGVMELSSVDGGEVVTYLTALAPRSGRDLLAHRSDETLEKALDCNSCHSNNDKHRSLFGADCAACHSTAEWKLTGFRHPSNRSRDCAQCHQAPPSHYMEHFAMISMKVAEVEHADVRQCYLCHTVSSWNEIRGVGWYKHH